MVGLSFAHGNTGIYLDTSEYAHMDVVRVLHMIRYILVKNGKKLICHNLFYDMAVTRFYLGRGHDLPFIADTYGAKSLFIKRIVVWPKAWT